MDEFAEEVTTPTIQIQLSPAFAIIPSTFPIFFIFDRIITFFLETGPERRCRMENKKFPWEENIYLIIHQLIFSPIMK